MRQTRRAALMVALLAACQAEDTRFARVKQITRLDEAIGGPTANARVGDYLIENDQIRAIIEQGVASYLPTSVGGTIVDIDLQRPQREFRGGFGLDQLGQIAAVANLQVAWAENPTQVRITRSLDGAEVTASARVEASFKILRALDVLIERRFADAPILLNLYSE